MSGSSKLTPEQQEFYEKKFGVRYTAIGEQPFADNRATRRAKRFGGNRRTPIDSVELQEARHSARERLAKQTIIPVVKVGNAVRVEGAEAEVLRDAQPPPIHP